MIENKDDFISTLNCLKSVDPQNQGMACMDGSKLPVSLKAVFGGLKMTSNSPKC